MHHLLPEFDTLENTMMPFLLNDFDRSRASAQAKKILTEVGLSERLDYKPEKLSVGQQQRVAVARALANRPKLVLADEPTGALDANNATQVLDLIRKLCREVSATLLLVTHDLDIAKTLERTVTLSSLMTNGQGPMTNK